MDLGLPELNDLSFQIEMTELAVLLCTYRKQKTRLKSITKNILRDRNNDTTQDTSLTRVEEPLTTLEDCGCSTIIEETVVSKEEADEEERSIQDMKKRLKGVVERQMEAEKSRQEGYLKAEEESNAREEAKKEAARRRQMEVVNAFYESIGLTADVPSPKTDDHVVGAVIDAEALAELDREEAEVTERLEKCAEKMRSHQESMVRWSCKLDREHQTLASLRKIDHDEQHLRRSILKMWSEDLKRQNQIFKKGLAEPAQDAGSLQDMEARYASLYNRITTNATSLTRRIEDEAASRQIQAAVYTELTVQ